MLQHHFNELHLYCRFRKMGLPHALAKGLAQTLSPKTIIYSRQRKNPYIL